MAVAVVAVINTVVFAPIAVGGGHTVYIVRQRRSFSAVLTCTSFLHVCTTVARTSLPLTLIMTDAPALNGFSIEENLSAAKQLGAYWPPSFSNCWRSYSASSSPKTSV